MAAPISDCFASAIIISQSVTHAHSFATILQQRELKTPPAMQCPVCEDPMIAFGSTGQTRQAKD